MKPKIRFPFDKKYRVSFVFGAAPNWYVLKTGFPHNGVDFACPVGTPILACDNGRVSYADNLPDADGIGINISHDWGLSQYWHLSRLTAKYNQVVKKGDTIGFSGATGWATGPHLHFGVKYVPDSSPIMRGWVDPLKYITGSQPPQVNPDPVNKTYRVRFGDNLWKIADKFYGKGWYWERIYKANMDKISDPGLIFPFQKLIIP